ncbi:(2Fe-2S)-binding protein [Alteribacillus iranensis]|uniref:BFD-like [2Fe-2S] binding domain-containing protein n=1 Tax=Alteribacillus iranensis TaxID=930128 RepID=A0A1I2BJK4_9BACI|nr:(2Fe-2S)-binding protein [Alteribacillus iranensis]SFE56384.1 BFD-like [2Fe-2S] binding domain-containing protein [Alteribacillus iranensis]
MSDVIICRCEGVCLNQITEAIDQGASSVPGIKKRVRVGMGYCQGRVCQPVVRQILESELKEDSKTKPPLQRAQSPVRPVLLGDILKE